MCYQKDVVYLQQKTTHMLKFYYDYFFFNWNLLEINIFSLPQWRQYFTPGIISKAWSCEPLRKPAFENNDNYNILIAVRILYISAAKIWKILVHIFLIL